MIHICTHSDYNYFFKGLALHHSLCEHAKDNFHLHYLANDEQTFNALSRIRLKNTTIHYIGNLEQQDKKLRAAKEFPAGLYGTTYSQYCWCLTPYFMRHVLKQIPKDDYLIYADSDIFFYHSPQVIIDNMQSKSIGIHQHRFSGDYRTDIDTGWYNVGVVVFKNNPMGNQCSRIWKNWLLNNKNEHFATHGQTGDQKYLELFIPLFGEENVCVFDKDTEIAHLAPWNVDQYVWQNGYYKVSYRGQAQQIVFNHFSHFVADFENNKWKDSNNGEWKPAKHNAYMTALYENYFLTQAHQKYFYNL